MDVRALTRLDLPADDGDHETVRTVKQSRLTVVMAVMYLLKWLCIYSTGETGHIEILTFKLNLILKV